MVLGSRWVPGGTVVNWPLHRKVLSVGGNLYTRVMLGMPVGDATGGYRAYRAAALKEMDLHDVASQGYCFQVDLVWRAVRRGLTVREVPITFVEREVGDSKMSSDIVRESLVSITGWGAGLPGPPGPHAAAPGAPVASALGPGGGAHGGARRMPVRRAWLVLVALLLVPVVEISLLIAVGHLIGVWPTIALVLVETLLGAYLVKREGLHARTALQHGAQQRADAGAAAHRRRAGARGRRAPAPARASSPTWSGWSSCCRSPAR